MTDMTTPTPEKTYFKVFVKREISDDIYDEKNFICPSFPPIEPENSISVPLDKMAFIQKTIESQKQTFDALVKKREQKDEALRVALVALEVLKYAHENLSEIDGDDEMASKAITQIEAILGGKDASER